jgi:hypothetical protein
VATALISITPDSRITETFVASQMERIGALRAAPNNTWVAITDRTALEVQRIVSLALSASAQVSVMRADSSSITWAGSALDAESAPTLAN